MVQFFGIVFPSASTPENFSADALEDQQLFLSNQTGPFLWYFKPSYCKQTFGLTIIKYVKSWPTYRSKTGQLKL